MNQLLDHPNKIPVKEDPLGDLSDGLRQKLWSTGRSKNYRAGETIVWPGDPGHKVRVLVSGSADVMVGDQEGRDVAVETLRPGDFVGELSYLLERPSPMNSEVVARDGCRVLEIPAPQFDRILAETPGAYLSVLRSLSRKVMRLDQSIYKSVRKKRALKDLISRQDHVFPDYFVSDAVKRRVGRRLEELAHSQAPLLITGETGVGKEFVAHAVYEMGKHHKGIFLALDLWRPLTGPTIASDDSALLDGASDLTEKQMRLFFGSEDGRDGRGQTPGYLEFTEDGTLLVQGIEQLTTPMQKKLLETLQTGSFRRVGGKGRITADCRLIGTTNLDPSEISPDEHPLLHWLASYSLSIAPLRKRRKEIPALAQHYVNIYRQELRKEIGELPKDTIKTLVSYSWPGNDRELATTLKRAVLLAQDNVLRPTDIYFDLRRMESPGKIDLLNVKALKAAVRSPLFPAIFQSAAAPFFFILLILLFLGPSDPTANLGGIFSWAVGWPTMIFGAFLWARFWCSLCPMGTLSHLAKRVVSLDLPFPNVLRQYGDWIAAGSVMLIIWLETATNIRNSPLNTGLLLLTIFVLAVAVSVVYEKQSWCRFLCPLGCMMGVFAKAAPVELRADRHVCTSQCTTNECFLGTGQQPGCPFGQMVPSVRSNRFCKLCGNCVKNCPHDAVNLQLRIPASEIWEVRQVAAVTAFLVTSMFGGLISEMSHKMAFFKEWAGYFSSLPEVVVLTVFFVAVVGFSNLLVLFASAVSSHVSGETLMENFARYGLTLLPVVLTGFMAFHLYYLIYVGVHFPAVLWNIVRLEFLRQMVITVPPGLTHFLQGSLVWLGMVGSVVISYKLSRGHGDRRLQSLGEFLPHGLLAVVFAVILQRVITSSFYHSG